jgi:hypothetical protein
MIRPTHLRRHRCNMAAVAYRVPAGLLGYAPLNAVPLGLGSDEVLDDIGMLLLAQSTEMYAACRARASWPPAPAPFSGSSNLSGASS